MTGPSHRRAAAAWWTTPTPRLWKILWIPWLVAVAILIATDVVGELPAWANRFPNPLLWYALAVTAGSWVHMYVIAYEASYVASQESGEDPARS